MTFRRLQVEAFALVLFAATALAQNTSSGVVGTITDGSRSPVDRVELDIRNTANNESRQAFTNAKGEFTVASLISGTYNITVTKEGFRTIHEDGLVLEIDQEARLEFNLEVGSVNQSVSILASVPVINTENAVKGEVLVTAEIVEIPLNGRDFTDLAFLTPGVLPKAAGGQGASFNINGARADNTNFIVDGFNDQNPRGAAIQVQPNLDALEEFKTQTTGYSAEYGRLAGGVVNMALKSGTNKYHGVLFEFLRNDIFDARNFFDAGKSALRRNQFGGTVGGPVTIPHLFKGQDRTFFLFSWESYKQSMGQNRLSLVPTTAVRQGDFSAFAPLKDPLLTAACTATVLAGCFPGNRIPLSRFSPVALAAQNYFPLPNRSNLLNNYAANIINPDQWDSYVAKLDHRFSPRDAISFRWLKRFNRTTVPFNGSDLGTFGSFTGQHQTLTGLSYTHTFGPSVIDEARLGFSRTADREHSLDAGIDSSAKLGVPSPSDPSLFGFPRFTVNGLAALGDGTGMPLTFTVNNFEYADTLTWVQGEHLVKFGLNVLHSQIFQPFRDNNRGTFNFLGKVTGQPYADFLLGYPDSASHQTNVSPNYLFATDYGIFVEDSWKVKSRLTLTLGLRYELPIPPFDKYGRFASYNPQLNQLVLASDKTLQGFVFANPQYITTAKQQGIPSSLANTRYNDVAPRLGFAWRPFGGSRTAVRGGYGIFFGTTLLDPIRASLGGSYPFTNSQTFNRQANNISYLTLADPFPIASKPVTGTINANSYDLNAKTPNLQSWNLTAEQEIGGQSALEIGYVGSKGTHLGHQYNINQPVRSAAAAPTFPLPYTGFNTINLFAFNANSTYNAATVTFRRRFNRGFFYRLSYSYGKSIDTASQFTGVSTGGYAGVQDIHDLNAERGRSDFDIRHALTAALSATAPWHNLFARGWQLAGTGIVYTGQPFTPQLSNVNLNAGEANRPDRIANGALANPTPDRWFDLAAFAPVPTGAFHFGNSGRNILDAPGSVQINLSLNRNFFVQEQRRLQVRWEVFNVLNHANLGVPKDKINEPNAGSIVIAKDARLMQFGLRYSF